MNPRISVIIPTYNAGKTVEAAIKSVVEQTYENIELIIADGLSKDNTAAIVSAYTKQYSNIVSIGEKDKGVYDAMNKAIARATGDWVFFLGADDIIYNNNTIFKIFDNVRGDLNKTDLIYGNVLLKDSRKIYAGPFTKWKLLRQNISHQAIFYKKSLFDKYGVFDLKYPLLSDYVFNLKLFSKKSLKKIYIPDIIAVYCEEGLSSTNRDLNFKKDWGQIVRQHYSFPYYIYGVYIFPVVKKISKYLSTR